jgi:hypothetical protein
MSQGSTNYSLTRSFAEMGERLTQAYGFPEVWEHLAVSLADLASRLELLVRLIVTLPKEARSEVLGQLLVELDSLEFMLPRASEAAATAWRLLNDDEWWASEDERNAISEEISSWWPEKSKREGATLLSALRGHARDFTRAYSIFGLTDHENRRPRLVDELNVMRDVIDRLTTLLEESQR